MSDVATLSPPVDAYLGLEVGRGKSLDQELQMAVEDEQMHQGTLTLTDDFSHQPADLTPIMAAWYKAQIAPKRLQALAALRARFESDSFGQAGVRGRFIEADRDQLEYDRRAEQRSAHDRFHRENHNLIQSRDEARRDYELERANENGREPVRPNLLLYWLVLLVIVAGEFLLNIESIRHVPIITSWALATGATAFCALALGAAGHIHGELLKQWNYWFGPQDRTRNAQGWRMVAIGTVLLLAALGFIAYARMSYIMPKIQEAAILGVAPPNLYGSVFSMLLTNIIVYAVSVGWSFYRHDANPDYVLKTVKFERLRAEAHARMNGLNVELARLDAKHNENVKKLEAFGRQSQSSAGYADNQAALARFQAQDEAVKGALDRYRSSLVQRLRREHLEPRFCKARLDKEDAGKVQVLNAEDWLATPLSLKLISDS